MTDPEIFIVRIWRQLASGFRASARRVDEEETRYFSRPDEVASFLGAAIKLKAESRDEEVRAVPRDSTSAER